MKMTLRSLVNTHHCLQNIKTFISDLRCGYKHYKNMQYITHFLREVDPRALVSANLRKSVFMFLKEPEIAATLFYWLIS